MSHTHKRCGFDPAEGQGSFSFCPYCGEALQPRESLATGESREGREGESLDEALCPPPRDDAKSPALAALLSFLLVGMGQVYIGQLEKGLALLGAVLMLLLTSSPGAPGLLILLANVLDAFLLARRLARGERVGKWEFFFNSNARARGRRGSLR